MEIKTTYIANDGTEFETEKECLAYEETLSQMSEYIQLFDRDFSPVEWNPEDYESMWNHTYYIIIEPHREEEVEEWWGNTFRAQLGVSPFDELDHDWKQWKKSGYGDEPTVFAYEFCNNNDWCILNEVYAEMKDVIRGLDLVDALS